MEKAQALVLRTVDWSETSRIVTLFTREFGKVRAVAKGARRPKSPFDAALDLLSICSVVFIRKTSDALDLLTEARLVRRFRPPGRDLSRLYAAYYVAELLHDLTDDHDPHVPAYDAAAQALASLAETGGGDSVGRIVLGFEVAALKHLGFVPELARCVGCGRELKGEGRVAFGMLAGGVLCADCRPGQRQVVSLSGPAWEQLRRLSAGTEETEASMDLKTRRELRGVMNAYVSHLAGRKLRMQDYLPA